MQVSTPSPSAGGGKHAMVVACRNLEGEMIITFPLELDSTCKDLRTQLSEALSSCPPALQIILPSGDLLGDVDPYCPLHALLGLA